MKNKQTTQVQQTVTIQLNPRLFDRETVRRFAQDERGLDMLVTMLNGTPAKGETQTATPELSGTVPEGTAATRAWETRRANLRKAAMKAKRMETVKAKLNGKTQDGVDPNQLPLSTPAETI